MNLDELIKKLTKYKNEKIIILGHDCVDIDTIVSGYLMEKVLKEKGFNAVFCIRDQVINKENLDILKEYYFNPSIYQNKFENSENIKYILVDHNTSNVKGEIISIIDHHPTSNEIKTKLYFNKSISSTAIYLCKGNEHYFNREDIQLAILATMLDTASFNSTKAREEDKLYVLEMSKKLNLNYNKLYEAGLYFTELDNLKESSLNGLKKYKFNNKQVESSYVHINNNKENDEKIKDIINILIEYRKNNNLEMFIFIVHNMTLLKTTVYKIKEKFVEEVKYDRYTSRGNDIMPSIEKELQ